MNHLIWHQSICYEGIMDIDRKQLMSLVGAKDYGFADSTNNSEPSTVMRRFIIYQYRASLGLPVAEGVECSNGRCIVIWLDEYESALPTYAVYPSMKEVERVHNNGLTVIGVVDDGLPARSRRLSSKEAGMLPEFWNGFLLGALIVTGLVAAIGPLLALATQNGIWPF
jgi:hypothetical protein